MIDTQLITRAGLQGIGVESSLESDGTATYAVFDADTGLTEHSTAAEAATEIAHRLQRLQDAAEAATARAEQWQSYLAEATSDIAAWNELATAVNAELPAGCETVPLVSHTDAYGLSGLQPMTAMVATALARNDTRRTRELARHRLDRATAAEGAVLLDAAEQPSFRPDYWDTVVTLKRPVQIARNIAAEARITNGMIEVTTDTRRAVAWNHYGIGVPLPAEQITEALDRLAEARVIIQRAADRHRDAADRLTNQLDA